MGHRKPEISGNGENTKLSITRSFFELDTPDFAWKFVWTVRTKYTHKKVQSTH